MEKAHHVELGELVFSKAGRDFGKAYLVIGVADDNTVLLADGEIRKIINPKRKNIKHLSFTDLTAENICVKLQGGASLNDSEVRKALRELISGQIDEQRS